MGEDQITEYILGDMVARYTRRTDGVEFGLLPATKSGQGGKRSHILPDNAVDSLNKKMPARFKQDSLLQIKLIGEPSKNLFSEGVTLFDSSSTQALQFCSQNVVRTGDTVEIQTVLQHPKGLRCVHHAVYRQGLLTVDVFSDVTNESNEPVTLELLSSFVLSGITPFGEAGDPERLRLHRFRTWWSSEGRHEARTLEEMHLERMLHTVGARSERFGQIGFMPARHFFPFMAVEDTAEGVLWGAKLAWPGSWQMEAIRRGHNLVLTGGLADREFGHWKKTLTPGETLTSPTAVLSCSTGDVDQFCQRFVKTEESRVPFVSSEELLPIIFNEWCSSWGTPTYKNVLAAADRLNKLPIKYFVIDDGWAERPPEARSQVNGDWVVDQNKFPGGLKPIADALRERGLIPGIWFEFEVCNLGSKAWEKTEHHLHRDGIVLQTGSRRHWNFCDSWVQEYLSEKVIRLLRESGIGYLKVDYNDTIGMGCDHPDSLGEGLRQQVLAVQEFFRKLRREVPGLVIENCASGGHRLEPSMMELASMGSFSDAHEGKEIAIIAANLQRLIPPRQSQIWAVLREGDSMQRIVYSLTAGCLGRLCISGDIATLSAEQMRVVKEGLEFYEAVAPIIKNGTSEFYGNPPQHYIHPCGWQAVVRYSDDETTALVVVHSFELESAEEVVIPLAGEWTIEHRFFHDECDIVFSEGQLRLVLKDSFVGQAYRLCKIQKQMK